MDLIAEIGGQLEIKSVVSRSAMDKLNPSTVLQKPRHNGVRHGWGTVGTNIPSGSSSNGSHRFATFSLSMK